MIVPVVGNVQPIEIGEKRSDFSLILRPDPMTAAYPALNRLLGLGAADDDLSESTSALSSA